MGLADRDYMRGVKKPSARPSLWARIRFGLWLSWKWLKGLFT